MTDETTGVILEILKRIQGEMTIMREDMRGIRVEMTGIKQQIAAFMSHEMSQDSDITALKLRLDCIERRLDLTDG